MTASGDLSESFVQDGVAENRISTGADKPDQLRSLIESSNYLSADTYWGEPKPEIYKFKNVVITSQGDLVFQKNGLLVQDNLGTGYDLLARKYTQVEIGQLAIKPEPKSLVHLDGISLNLNIAWGDAHYHFVLELLPRLYFLKEVEPKIFQALRYILIPHNLSGDYLVFLMFLFPELRCSFIRLEPQKLYSPTFLISVSQISTSVIGEFKKFVNDKTVINFSRRSRQAYYLTRLARTNHKRSRSIVNERELIDLLKRKGVQVFDPGSVSIIEQMHILSNASGLLSIHGGGLTNALFSKVPNAFVYEFFGGRYLNPCFYRMAVGCGLIYRVSIEESMNLSDAGTGVQHFWDNHFTLDLQHVEKELNELL